MTDHSGLIIKKRLRLADLCEPSPQEPWPKLHLKSMLGSIVGYNHGTVPSVVFAGPSTIQPSYSMNVHSVGPVSVSSVSGVYAAPYTSVYQAVQLPNPNIIATAGPPNFTEIKKNHCVEVGLGLKLDNNLKVNKKSAS